MHRLTRLFGAGLVPVVWVALCSSSVTAQEAVDPTTFTLSPTGTSGTSGDATLVGRDGGVEVTLQMQGLPEAGTEHINHIHGGATCADERAGEGAPATIPLNTVVANEDGTGSATTLLRDESLARLLDGEQERYVLLHAEAEEGGGIPPGIACADLVPTTGGGEAAATPDPQASGNQTAPLAMPNTGGVPLTAFLAAGTLVPVLILVGIGLLVLRRSDR